jgi:succinate dehydrogenase / fumarate reductase cytochrome b subunit
MPSAVLTVFQSSLGKKFAMGVTGLFLVSFLVVHCGVNALVFLDDGGVTFNVVAHFMSTNVVIRTMEVVLFLGILWHIVQALVLTRINQKARPRRYAVENAAANSTWYSRWMGLLGTLILVFLVIHLGHFWVGSRFTGLDAAPVVIDGKHYEDLYSEMRAVFSAGWVVAVYVTAMVSLAYHLLHGFQSAFQSLGLNHRSYTPAIRVFGIAFSVVVPLLFALMPLAFYLRLIQ